MIIGAQILPLTLFSIVKTLDRLVPFSIETLDASWIKGPSASASEYGTPSSIASAPCLSSSNKASKVKSIFG